MFLFPFVSNASTLRIGTPKSNNDIDGSYTSSILINANEDECLNAFNITINYSPSLIEIDSISKSESISVFWIEESIDNESGRVTLLTGVPNGFCGRGYGDLSKSSIIANLVFKYKKDNIGKTTDFIFDRNSEVLNNDGFGTRASLSFID